MISVKLPNKKLLKCQSTGKRKKLKYLLNATLFEMDGQIWEKVPESCVNLSDLNDGSEPLDYNQYVEIYEECK